MNPLWSNYHHERHTLAFWTFLLASLACCAYDITRVWKGLECHAEPPDVRSGSVTAQARSFNTTINKWSLLDQTVLMRQLRDDSTSKRYRNNFVSADSREVSQTCHGCLPMPKEISSWSRNPRGRHARNVWACQNATKMFGCAANANLNAGLHCVIATTIGAQNCFLRNSRRSLQIEIPQHHLFASSKSLCSWRRQFLEKCRRRRTNFGRRGLKIFITFINDHWEKSIKIWKIA